MRAMKDSGIAWIGEIPEEWKIVRNKNAFVCNKELVGEKSALTQLLSLTTRGIKKKDINNAEGKLPESFDTYQFVRENDIVMCLFDLDCSAVFSGISPIDGMISPAYRVLSCKECIEPRYADYWFRYISDGRKFNHFAKNIRYTLSYEEFSALPLLLPKKVEQRRIADYLDRKCSQIDTIIARQQEVIEKLKAYKLSVITEAVTKGLNPHVPMKDSGVEWIGEIPEHWKLAKLKKYCHPQTGITPSTSNAEWFDGEVQWFTPGDFNGNYHLVKSKRTLSTKALESSVAVVVPANTVMIICIGATAGKVGLADVECSFNQQITALLTNSLNPKFLMYWMIANTKFIRETALFTTLPILNNQTIGDYLLLFPANEDEEKQIVDFLDEKCNKIDSTITARENVINKLSEYKKSLIYEVVTGKKEV